MALIRVMGVKPLYYALPGAFGPSNTKLLYLKTDLPGLQKEFEKVRAKVKFIHGDKDDWVPIENIAYGKKMLTNATHISWDPLFGAGHLIPSKKEGEFRNLLLQMQ